MDSAVEKELVKKEQIPTEYNEEQTLRFLRKQDRVPGGQREKTISSFPLAATLAQILKDFNFPADKKAIITFVENISKPEAVEVLPLLQKINDNDDHHRQYQNVLEVAEAARLVQ